MTISNGRKRMGLAWLLIILTALPVVAQPAKPYWLIRINYLHSNVSLVRKPIQQQGYLAGIEPMSSYYVGLGHGKPVSNFIDLFLEVSYQRKGVTTRDFTNKISSVNQYRYIGLTPALLLKPTPWLNFSVGTELNTLLSKQAIWPNTRSFEWGISGRLMYSIHPFGVNVGLTRAITPHNSTSVIPGTGTYFNFINYNWQAGFFYVLN